LSCRDSFCPLPNMVWIDDHITTFAPFQLSGNDRVTLSTKPEKPVFRAPYFSFRGFVVQIELRRYSFVRFTPPQKSLRALILFLSSLTAAAAAAAAAAVRLLYPPTQEHSGSNHGRRYAESVCRACCQGTSLNSTLCNRWRDGRRRKPKCASGKES
jgi:hypothetical protein